MPQKPTFVPIPKEKQRQHAVNILNHVTEVLYYFFEENEEGLENDEVLDNFISFLWEISVLCMGSLNMKVLGETEDGKVIAEIKPVESVKKMLVETSAAEETDRYYETDVEDTVEKNVEIDLGDWESVFTSAAD